MVELAGQAAGLGFTELGVTGGEPFLSTGLPSVLSRMAAVLRWTNNRDRWAFAIWLASKEGYEQSVLPSGALVGTVEEAMDCACGLYLNDISAWELPRQRSAPPH